ncbi:signal peptidase II [Gardnerella sp. 2492-Sm]|uniref:signal peptidase II n=1 Tax=unclassified Gardnerella TaxID=2628112 RepID=UPI003D078803
MRVKRLRTRAAVFALIVIVGLVIDRATKVWALGALQYGRQILCIPNFLSLALVRNSGASFGLGSSLTCVISILAIIACSAMLAAVRRTTSLQWTIALSLGFAGAFGNLIDRATYAENFLDGKVVDFINYGWSVGNVADIILVFAGLWFVALILFETPFYADEKDDKTEPVDSNQPEDINESVESSK